MMNIQPRRKIVNIVTLPEPEEAVPPLEFGEDLHYGSSVFYFDQNGVEFKGDPPQEEEYPFIVIPSSLIEWKTVSDWKLQQETPDVFSESGDEDVYFWHPRLVLRTSDEYYGTPWSRATVAYCIYDTSIVFGISFCSPKDIFCKREGRNRAEERLLDYEEQVSIPTSHRLSGREARTVIAAMINVGHLFDMPNYPLSANRNHRWLEVLESSL
jgi:hypothetical protein